MTHPLTREIPSAALYGRPGSILEWMNESGYTSAGPMLIEIEQERARRRTLDRERRAA